MSWQVSGVLNDVTVVCAKDPQGSEDVSLDLEEAFDTLEELQVVFKEGFRALIEDWSQTGSEKVAEVLKELLVAYFKDGSQEVPKVLGEF